MLPIELSGNAIYRIGHGMPFYNISSALRTVLFGTRNHIARTCGILLGWVCLSYVATSPLLSFERKKVTDENPVFLSSLITIPLITWFMRRKDVKREMASQVDSVNPTSEKRV